MGQKHGVWFDLLDHLAIHTKVLSSYSWLVKSGDDKYTLKTINHGTHLEISHEASFYTNNGFYVEIAKRTISSSEKPPKYGMTKSFSYDCFDKNKKEKVLQYHSPHSTSYNSNAPWHDKPHRHIFIGNQQFIEIYSFDHRPLNDRLKKYSWEKGSINLLFLGHEDWPFVSEFLEEVVDLNV